MSTKAKIFASQPHAPVATFDPCLLSLLSARASLPGVRRRLQVAAQLRGGGRHRAPAGLRSHRAPFLQPGAPGSAGAAEKAPPQGQDTLLSHYFSFVFQKYL